MALYKRSETVRDFNGVVVSKVSVKVVTGDPYSETSPLASLFQDAAGLIPLANPLTADAAGQYSYWAAGGTYSEKISRPGYYSVTNDGFLVGGEKGDTGPMGNPGTPGPPGFDVRPLLSDGTDPTNGSGMVAHNESLMYAAGSIGKALQNRLFTTDLAETGDPTTGANMVGLNTALGYSAGTVGKFLKDLVSSIGATLIGYLASFTGAVQRSQANKNTDFVSVKDFGAVGDGVTDDTAAIQAAITYVASIVSSYAGIYTGRCKERPKLFFPRGRYLISSGFTAITVGGMRFFGDGITDSIIIYTGAAPITLFDFGTFSATPADLYLGTAQEFSFSDLTFIRELNTETVGARTCTAIRDNGCGNATVRDCMFVGWKVGFLGAYGSDFDVFDNVVFQYCDIGSYFGPGSQQLSLGNVQYFRCDIGLCLDHVMGITLIRPAFVNAHTASILIEAYAGTATRYLTNWPAAGISQEMNLMSLNSWFESNAGGLGAADITPDFIVTNNVASDAYRDLVFKGNRFVGGSSGGTHTRSISASTGTFPCQRVKIEDSVFNGVIDYIFFTPGGSSTAMDFRTTAGSTAPTLANSGAASVKNIGVHEMTTDFQALPATDQKTDAARTTGIEHVFNVNGVLGWGFLNGGTWFVRMGMDIQNRRFFFNDPTTPSTSISVHFATVVPASGTYATGSKVFNSAPSVGQPKGWVCTVGGTPGTWVSEGNL